MDENKRLKKEKIKICETNLKNSKKRDGKMHMAKKSDNIYNIREARFSIDAR